MKTAEKREPNLNWLIESAVKQFQGHAAQNILEGEISPSRNWLCEKGTDRAVAILQLKRTTLITSVHVGNAHSAFVEVLVGKAADGSDNFECLIPMSILMSPHESKTGTNPNKTRFFNRSDFNKEAATKSWDRVKVVCSQPFNKHVPYGLCFLKIHGEREARKEEVQPKDEIQIGSFFKRKRDSGGDKPLTVGEQMKEAEKEMLKQSPTAKAGPSGEKPEEKRERKPESKKKEEKTPKKRAGEKRAGESTPKRRKEEKPERRIRKKAFEKLMEDVVLVISGFKNPLRGDIRTMALEMGAKYSADWEPHCTHLVCAYENTPKFRQVKGRGKIVRKDWVESCHRDRKRYPWRRFALDKADLGMAESEEEIHAGEELDEQVSSPSKAGSSRSSTKQGSSGNEDYDAATDDEDEKKVDTTDYPMPHLPDVFNQETFYVDPSLRERATLERYIVAYNGILTETLDEDLKFYVTDRGGAPVELFRRKAPNLVAIKPSWIWEINSKQKRISTSPHLVN